jgi:hypothetical protein
VHENHEKAADHVKEHDGIPAVHAKRETVRHVNMTWNQNERARMIDRDYVDEK